MNEHIAKLAWRHLLPERYSRYGETIEGDHYEFEPEELQEFVDSIVKQCCDWIDGSPSNESGQLLLSKSFMIANLKAYLGVES